MRKLQLFFLIFVPLYCNAQINESFSDGDFLEQPEWAGLTANFMVNSNFQLQSKAASTSVSWLFTPSMAFDDAAWECSLKINYTTSASNYACVYIVSDVIDLTAGCNGYYVQVGGTNDEVSLFLQQGTKKTKIIDGADKRTDGNPVEIRIRVTRDKLGNFTLYSKLPAETTFQTEGKIKNTTVTNSQYFGLLYSNTTTTGNAYFFDDIIVTGNPAPDLIPPSLQSVILKSPTKIWLQFSEAITVANATFSVNNGQFYPTAVQLSNNKKEIELIFANNFEQGIIYVIEISSIADLAGNAMISTKKKIGIAQKPVAGDIVWNEIMFEAPDDGQEYVEVFNNSEKIIDLSKITFATRKTDGSFNTAVIIPLGNILGPNEIVAFAPSPDSVYNYHRPPADAQIIATSNWYNLNNESSTLTLCNLAKDTIYDEVKYDSRWHHVLIADKKGIALERINPNMLSQNASNWHSAASEVNYGTPGYQNSQFRAIGEVITEKAVWCEPEVFSPDNDGSNDICFVRYNTEYAGFIANVMVFTATGVKIAELAQNALLSTSGFLTWDGKTLGGTNAETGIYLLYFEMFHAETGQKIIQKLPLVVTAR